MIRKGLLLALGTVMIVLMTGCAAGVSGGGHGSGVGVGAGISLGY